MNDWNYLPRQGYIKACEEYESLPKIHGWVARDMNGDVNLFVMPPDREVGYWSSFDKYNVPISEEIFPNLKWEDAPVEVELLIYKI